MWSNIVVISECLKLFALMMINVVYVFGDPVKCRLTAFTDTEVQQKSGKTLKLKNKAVLTFDVALTLTF